VKDWALGRGAEAFREARGFRPDQFMVFGNSLGRATLKLFLSFPRNGWHG
jgi:hypothetical protein